MLPSKTYVAKVFKLRNKNGEYYYHYQDEYGAVYRNSIDSFNQMNLNQRIVFKDECEKFFTKLRDVNYFKIKKEIIQQLSKIIELISNIDSLNYTDDSKLIIHHCLEDLNKFDIHNVKQVIDIHRLFIKIYKYDSLLFINNLDCKEIINSFETLKTHVNQCKNISKTYY